MNRRGFLGLGSAVAAALVLPEARRLYFIGGWPGAQERAVPKLIEEVCCFPKPGQLCIHGFRAGRDDDEWAADIERIRQSDWYQGMALKLTAARFVPTIWSKEVVETLNYTRTLEANRIQHAKLPSLYGGTTIAMPRLRNLETT